VLDADEIVHGLWLGSQPPTGAVVADAGFDVLVLCARGFQPAAERFSGGVRVIYAPNDDIPWKPPPPEDLTVALRAAQEVISSLRKRSKVLVTCLAGVNRSALVVALAMNGYLGYSGNTCVEIIRKNRRLGPDAIALSNPHFFRSLVKLPGTDLVPDFDRR
jgi:protein-tyrosine phosphatase